jgi:hypothetical protein
MASCSFRPVSSCRDQPKIRSAAGFIKVTRFAVGDEDGVRRAVGYRGEQVSCSASCSSALAGVMSVPKVWNETISPASSKNP